MSPTKIGRILRSRSGKDVPFDGVGNGRIGSAQFAAAISDALHRDYGEQRSAIKTIVRLTSANERAVKNWYEGRNGPSGEFLMVLCRHSDQVLETVLTLSGRSELMRTKRLLDAKRKVREIMRLLDKL